MKTRGMYDFMRVLILYCWAIDALKGNGALACLTYVTSGSVVKRSLSSFKAIVATEVYFQFENADDKKQIADDTKQIEDDTKQNRGMKTYGICGSPRVPI
ncbi:hypothetical protein T4A_3237, partial [Trichinella pseudospiralis]